MVAEVINPYTYQFLKSLTHSALEKSHTSAASVTFHQFRQTSWRNTRWSNIKKTTWQLIRWNDKNETNVNTALQYAAVKKLGSKCSTLATNFSIDFYTKFAQFLTERKKAKNLLLVFAKKKVGVKKIVLINAKILVLNTFLANTSK